MHSRRKHSPWERAGLPGSLHAAAPGAELSVKEAPYLQEEPPLLPLPGLMNPGSFNFSPRLCLCSL